MLNPGRRVTRAMIIEHVWNLSFDTGTNVIDVYVNYLRTGFQVAMVSAEHLTYREFLGGIPEVTYLGSCKLAPFSIHGLIQLDLVVAFLLIDVLLERRRYWPAPSARNYGDRGTGVGDGDAHNMPGAAVGLARPGTRVSVRTAAKAWPGSTTNASGRKN